MMTKTLLEILNTRKQEKKNFTYSLVFWNYKKGKFLYHFVLIPGFFLALVQLRTKICH